VASAVKAMIRGYQLLRAGRPTGCRFVPSCSAYALEAIDEHGLSLGTWFSLRRLARCHPFGGHGADPVPQRPPLTES
jgi:uncharacterized protein